MEAKYCIFDMDGTLVDSMGEWDKLQHEILAAKGVEAGRAEAIVEAYHLTLYDSAVFFIQRFGLPDDPAALEKEMNDAMERRYRTTVPAKPGVQEFMRRLKAQGTTMCVVTCSEEQMVRACLNRLEMEQNLQFVLSCADLGCSKERPDGYFEAVRRMGCRPEETVVFEDSLSAARTAKAAGFQVVGVYDINSADTWQEMTALADRTIMGWEELL